ncbi:Zinc finger, CCCH-type [Kalmanozyma brasiliensis GHG001]|uniref:C3H1-type domain-containing protein n=1 Tax=Kalmanozyma brasiliensis (strain GHG001) TaxID=1365824 RepID=V5E8Q1_KALBG|nr:Zinc finger, CCCH-type [Kalmanozyma brasiliensis GHG001]EST06696.1 Zinc finger, CCCH-type [Kalmanozyma brasiliensis GHG001]
MTATLFQAVKDGNVELVSSLLEEPSLDIDARDETGNTALLYAVRGNHIDVVSQLLVKGANAIDVAQDSTLKQNPELEAMINGALQHTQSTAFQTAPVIDSHGGKQLPDGTVSYVQPPNYQAHSSMDASLHQQHAFHHAMSQPMYPFQPPHNSFFDPTHQPEHRGHASKDSASGSLPPPDVAKMIPCRFFPNCRYGDKCMFAHPVAMPSSASNAGPVSPGAQMFYPSHGYGYPAYGPPQHFYSMAPPMPIQYTHAGVPMPVHMPPPPHMAPASHSAEQGESYGNHFDAQHQQPFEPEQAQEDDTKKATDNEASQDAPAETSPAAVSEETKADTAAVATDNEAAKASAPTSASNTTSFSAFMAHHAAPFQPGPGAPNGLSVGADGNVMSGSQPFSRGSKGPRRGGASMGGAFGSRTEFGKRSTERPACHFFARSACKHGEDCRFPHILPDGTDMRGPNAGRSSHSIEAARAINRALAAKNTRGSTNGSHANGTGAALSQQTGAASDTSSLPSASTNVTVSTSPASAQTTITSADQNEASESPSADKVVSQDAHDEKPEAVVNHPASNGAAKKEQVNGPKANGVTATASASSAPKATASGKSESKGENTANGKRVAAAGKSEDGKPASALPSSINGDRIPASVPSKPVLNGNANGAAPANRQNGAKPQPNGVQGGKGQQNQQGGARARTNQNGNGRANGQTGQNGAAQKKYAPQQRLPSADDFPALSIGPGSSAPAAAQASSANGAATKVNFSAILSAPAPPKKQPEPVKEVEAAAAADDKVTAVSSEEVKQTETESKSSSAAAPKQPSSTVNGTAAPMLDFAAVVQSNPVAV